MSATLLPNAEQQFLDANGKPLAGGSVYFYIPLTTTFKNTWQDSAQTILNTNPVILDAAGRAIIWGSGSYRQVVYDQFNNLVWDQTTEDSTGGLIGNYIDVRYVAGTDFTPGTTTTLPLPSSPGSIDNTWIFFDAAYQANDQVSSIVGTTLTFVSPIPVGVDEVNIKIGSSVAIGTPGNGSVGDAQLAWGPTLRRNFASIAALRAAPGNISSAFVESYYTGGTSYQGPYDVNTSDTTSADNGGSIIVDSLGRRWYMNSNPDWFVEQFGAKGDGSTDDTAAIQAAITALPNRGGVVRFEGKQYNITASLVAGNGNAGSTSSTKNGVKLIGQGGGFGTAPTPATQIFAAASIAGPMLKFSGEMSDVTLENIEFYGNLNASIGVEFNAVSGLLMRRCQIAQFLNTGLYILAGNAPTGNYNIINEFHQVVTTSTNNGHQGLLMDGDYTDSNDTWLTQFFTCRFDTTSATGAIAAYFKFVDSCSFHRCHMTGNNTGGVGLSGCFGAYFNAVGNNGFPSGLAFYDCSILSTFVNETTDKIRVNYFYGYGTYDNEAIPTHPNLKGITDQGIVFNGLCDPTSQSISSTAVGYVETLTFNTTTNAVLPAGGTWEYDIILANAGVVNGRGSGVQPGGSVIDTSGNTKYMSVKRVS
ncbi:hypothetical protein [Paraburkholderia sacchari]|uniref:hypothetical protein n=1 Tax=Paraburkholderia sacchari TaxID=159450 RepID=UPI003D980365